MTELPPAARLGGFGVALLLVLAAGFGLGRATGELRTPEPVKTTGQHGEAAGHGAPARSPEVSGTSLSADGLRLEVPRTTLSPGRPSRFSFQVLDEHGPVRDYDVEQGKRMHLVVVGRDLFRHTHVHPELAADGTWSVELTLAPGSYRAVADFSTGGRRHSLGVDLAAPGPLELTPLPAPATTAVVDDLRVELEREGAQLSFTAYDRAGEPVVPEPYLGARGHLVAFRAGDLAYAHVHPAGEKGATTAYDAELPGPGRYRLFLELQVDGRVRTAAFTLEVSP